jgi:hypothetical protein
MVHGKQRKYLVGAAVALALVATLVVAAVGAEASGSQSNADATHVHTGSERGASALTSTGSTTRCASSGRTTSPGRGCSS